MAVDVKRFSEELVYRSRSSCAQLLADLRFLRDFDVDKEKRQGRAFSMGCGALLFAGVILCFVGSLVTNVFAIPVFLGGCAVLLLGTGIYSFVRHSRYKRLNLENRRYELVTRMLELLRADISPTEPVGLQMDLRPETDAGKLRGESRTRSGWSVKHYVDPWLSLEGRLLDGTHFNLKMIERIDMRSRSKRNARGKTKTKTRRESDALLRVRLRVKPSRYQHLQRLGPRAKGAVQLPPGARLKSLHVGKERIDLTVVLEAPWAPRETPPPKDSFPMNAPPPVNGARVVAMSLLSLYQLLNLSRALDKKAVHPPVG
ncbi:hypothetical protein [Archangium sp.]|uniref:hypothetical protein n=1 Tax=Archangium sp. TaxID=1872627 RepID=UPI002ED87ABF